MPAPLILLVDPDVSAAAALEGAGYAVAHAETAATAQEHLDKAILVLMELELPDQDGVVLVSEIRDHSRVPILVCTTREGHEQALALKFGADMAVRKPVAAAELVARVRAVLRRCYIARGGSASVLPMPPLYVGPIGVDHAHHAATVNGVPLLVTPIEFRILAAVCAEHDHVLASEHLCELVWGDKDADASRVHVLAVHVGRLRRKLAIRAVDHLLQTVRSVGYILIDPDNDTPKGEP